MVRAAERNNADLADRILSAAEALYGELGLEGVSLRQISAAAGTANNYAVQYHFRDMDGLISAMLAKRMPEIEAQRAARLADVQMRKQTTTRALLDVMYVPLIEHANAAGERTFARFALALFSSPHAGRYAAELRRLTPSSTQVLDMLCAKHPDIPAALLLERQRLLGRMVLASVFDRGPYQSKAYDDALIDNVLDMAAAALVAPVSESAREMMKDARTNPATRRARR